MIGINHVQGIEGADNTTNAQNEDSNLKEKPQDRAGS